MLNTLYGEIVNVDYIGESYNPIKVNDLLKKAEKEKLEQFNEKVLVVGIDYQQDFMPKGSLGVKGAKEDINRFTKFIYDNMGSITKIMVSLDTHSPHQIFFPIWWINEKGGHVEPYTTITLDDINSGKYRPFVNCDESYNYVKWLKEARKKELIIWPYHCLKGTPGNTLENQLANMLYFYSVVKRSIVEFLVKGEDLETEQYGIYKSEYSEVFETAVLDYLYQIKTYDKIIIAGEAKDYCVLESLIQIIDFYKNSSSDVLKKIYILEDCMSSVDPSNKEVDNKYKEFSDKYGINIVNSQTFKL